MQIFSFYLWQDRGADKLTYDSHGSSEIAWLTTHLGQASHVGCTARTISAHCSGGAVEENETGKEFALVVTLRVGRYAVHHFTDCMEINRTMRRNNTQTLGIPFLSRFCALYNNKQIVCSSLSHFVLNDPKFSVHYTRSCRMRSWGVGNSHIYDLCLRCKYWEKGKREDRVWGIRWNWDERKDVVTILQQTANCNFVFDHEVESSVVSLPISFIKFVTQNSPSNSSSSSELSLKCFNISPLS